MQQGSFLTTGVRETRTTSLRDRRVVSLFIKSKPPILVSSFVEEPRQVPWLAYFIGLSVILALANAFILPVTQEGPHFSADKAVAQVQKAEYALLPSCCRRGIGSCCLFTFDRCPGPPQFLGESPG
jgi:hypothetical protein